MAATNSANPPATTRAAAVLAGSILVLCQGAAWGDYAARPAVQDYMDALVAEHGFARQWLDRVFTDAKKSDTVLKAISRPAEKALAWRQYRKIFLTDERIAAAVTFESRNRAALAKAAQTYGVAEEIVLAIVGVETFYGRYLGSYRVIDSLATLAFDYPRRADFFRNELTEFLLLAREEGKDPFEPKGSYAGAMGYGQFIPSSYRNFAVDFDGDGRRDIWTNETDAIAASPTTSPATAGRATGRWRYRWRSGTGTGTGTERRRNLPIPDWSWRIRWPICARSA